MSKKTVQEYIDETPVWSDGTPSLRSAMTRMQWKIWILATAGKFFEGLVVFMTGIALHLIAFEFNISSMEQGVVGAATLFGILIGATALGGLSDIFGRKRMFVVELILFALFLVGLVFAQNFYQVVIFLFGAGVALGCDYPTAHVIISESTASKNRGTLVLGAFAFQAVGALVGTMIGYIILANCNENVQAWRWMYATAILPAILIIISRLSIVESPHWLISKGRIREAQEELEKLLKKVPHYPKRIDLDFIREENEIRTDEKVEHKKQKLNFISLFSTKHRRATIFASVPWFLQDLGTYGIGIFTPTILAATIGQKHSEHNISDLISNQMMAAKGTAMLDVLLIVGILFAVRLSDSVGRIKLQIFGFLGCSLGLLIVALSQSIENTGIQMTLIFVGFMLFNFMTNLGPNAQTYLIAGEVFPTKIRSTGAGFAASFAKIGAVTTAFLFPVLLADIGVSLLLYFLASTSLFGAYITWKYQIETRGINLEKM